MKKILTIALLLLSALVFAQDNAETEKKEPVAVNRNIPGGYGSLQWGVLLSKARENIAGKLVYTDEKTIIISKDGELKYYYGFFYKDPAKISVKKETETATEEKVENDEGKLFYVALRFPYLAMNSVLKKMTDKYGKPTNDNIIKNQGAIAWDSEKTIIVMWVDNYEKKPFCRRITYINKEAIKEINQYHHDIFNKTEKALINTLKP